MNKKKREVKRVVKGNPKTNKRILVVSGQRYGVSESDKVMSGEFYNLTKD